MEALALPVLLCHWPPMQPGNKRAGGCFLMAAILLGFGVGIWSGNVLLGLWSGLGIGIVAAVATWLLDRSKSRS